MEKRKAEERIERHKRGKREERRKISATPESNSRKDALKRYMTITKTFALEIPLQLGGRNEDEILRSRLCYISNNQDNVEGVI